MSDILNKSAKHPLFKSTLATGLAGITSGAQLLISLGIDVSNETIAVLKKIEEILRDATYNSIDLDGLLSDAQAIGDEIEKKSQQDRTDKGS